MAGFGGGYGDAHGFGVAHFPDHDDVRRLTQRGTKRGGKIRSVDADFHLFDDAAHMVVLVLNGIFDDDDMTGFAVVDVVDERGQGGGLARACGSANEHQAALQVRQRFDGRRKT
jgi:hypothetical protein